VQLLRRASCGAQALQERHGQTGGLPLATPRLVDACTITRRDDRLELAGRLTLADATAIWRELSLAAATASGRMDLDVRGAQMIDGAVMPLLVETRSALAARGVACELVGVTPEVRPVAHLFGADRPPTLRPIVRGGGSQPRFPLLIARAGTDGIPIVLVLNFLAGFVMAYQSTRPLELYGANVFVADIVGISITRELAPLMTAIIIAGRSGAGYAAELGTMRVSEEIDAMRTMGIDPIAYLVLPRIATLVLVAPVLTLLGETVGVLGGVGVAVTSLDLTPEAYLHELRTAVVGSDVWTGLIKSAAFGAAVAAIGCRQGLTTRGAAAGVGQSTTTTVVQALFAIVLLDTLLTMIFRVVGV
jgi:phospholipid/cholesterol/gamma-HCH transport system permease protein